jgi:hypothetical protein
MNSNATTVIRIGLATILIVLGTLKNRDLRFVENQYKEYVIEFIDELEAEGIEIPEQIRWTVQTDISLFRTNTLGWAQGMNDNRQVLIRLHPLLKFKSGNELRFILWHELAHDVFNIKHGTIVLMQPSSTPYDAFLFPAAKIELIQYLKDNR